MSFLDILADEALPPEEVSHWYCDRIGCNGDPHGEHWIWCNHTCAGRWTQEDGCSLSCGKGEGSHHKASCRHARAAQVPPVGNWFLWMLLTGRGFGKSRSAAEWMIESAWTQEPAEWCVIARNAADVRKNARDLEAGLEVIARRDDRLRQYNRHEEDIYLGNGAVIHCLSADKPDKLRGYNLAGCWADELASWRYLEETWSYGLLPALRVGEHPRVVITTTPKPVPLLKKLVEEARAEEELPLALRTKIITTGSTWDNAQNLASNFIAEMKSSFEGTRVGRQELEGELIFDLSGTLVSMDMIERGRCTLDDFPGEEDDRPEERILAAMQRVVVAVDPAGTYGEDADETGIVVVAKGKDGHGYVLEDASGKYSPAGWARKAGQMYVKWSAFEIVAERNMGNDMVDEVVRVHLPNFRFRTVRAVLNKILRAEPVTALYEFDLEHGTEPRIHHVGDFPVLEEQLTTFTPETAMRRTRGTSPDRMDAMVHGFTELGLVRFGPTAAFRSFMAQSLERGAREAGNPETGDPSDPRAARLALRHLRGIQSSRNRGERARSRVQRGCHHRWRYEAPHDCVYGCGAVNPNIAVVAPLVSSGIILESGMDIIVRTVNPDALDLTVQQLGAAVVVEGSWNGDTCIVRVLAGDPGYIKYAIATQGYGEIVEDAA